MTAKRATAQYDAANLAAAAIVLEDVAKYGGEQAALVQWARTIMAQVPVDVAPGPLFAEVAA